MRIRELRAYSHAASSDVTRNGRTAPHPSEQLQKQPSSSSLPEASIHQQQPAHAKSSQHSQTASSACQQHRAHTCAKTPSASRSSSRCPPALSGSVPPSAATTRRERGGCAHSSCRPRATSAGAPRARRGAGWPGSSPRSSSWMCDVEARWPARTNQLVSGIICAYVDSGAGASRVRPNVRPGPAGPGTGP